MNWPLRHAVRCLRQGGIVAYPTEAVYGLGCDPLNRAALERLWALKRRPRHKAFILLAADLSQLHGYVALTPELEQRVAASWPGPVTWLLPVAPELPQSLSLNGKIAVRVTAHASSAALCRAFGAPLISTSANLSGKPPARQPLQIRCQFGKAVYLLRGALGGLAKPTPIFDAVSGQRLR